MTIRFILGFLIGLLIGASIALAFSARPGEAVRRTLVQRSGEPPSGEPT